MNFMFLYLELYISSVISIIQMYASMINNKHCENNLYNYIFKQKLILIF